MPKLSACRRFAVLESLHIDRKVFESLESWAVVRGLRPQDAIQLAICAFNETAGSRRDQSGTSIATATPPPARSLGLADDNLRCVSAEREDEGGVGLLSVADRVDAHEGALELRRHRLES